MNKKSPCILALSCVLAAVIGVPSDVMADSAVRAGEISRVIPAVNIARGSKSLTASAKM
jgi:hypothetical protein